MAPGKHIQLNKVGIQYYLEALMTNFNFMVKIKSFLQVPVDAFRNHNNPIESFRGLRKLGHLLIW